MKTSLWLAALLFCGAVAHAQPSSPSSVPQPAAQVKAAAVPSASVPQVKLRIELLDVTCSRQQEFFGGDEFFAMWVFSAMRNTTYATRLSREETYFGVTRPISIKKGETKKFPAGTFIFDGVLPATAMLSGKLRALEEDENHKWDALSYETRNNTILARMNTYKRNREAQPQHNLHPITSEDLEAWARITWTEYANPKSTDFVDLDDLIATWPLEIAAEGAPVQGVKWIATGDGATYIVHYLITREFVFPTRPTPPVTTPPVTNPPATTPPVTEPPVTTPPITEPPVVTPPVIEPPVVTPPVTVPPVPPVTVPPPATVPPVITPPTPPVVVPPVPPTPASAFSPLRYFGVRVDSVQPNLAGDKLEISCTFRNRMPRPENINGSMIRAVVTDADGVGYLNYTAFYRPTGAADLMAGNREIAPQGEIKVRLLVDIPPGTASLKTLTLWETSSQSQSVDISNVQWPSAKPAANLAALKLNSGNAEFRPCGGTLDVRFDGFRKARNGFYEAFFTFKNTTEALTFDAVPELHRGSFDVFTLGADGAKQSWEQLNRANGEQAIPVVMHYAIVAGGQARLRYTFSAKDDVPTPVKVVMTDRTSQTTLEWNVTAQ